MPCTLNNLGILGGLLWNLFSWIAFYGLTLYVRGTQERKKEIMGKCAHIGTAVFLSLFLMMASCWWEGVKGPYLCRSGSMSNHSAHLGHCFLLLILVSKLSAVPGISSVHEVHIWELISGKIIATLHIKYQRDGGDQDANRKVREVFHNAGIHNVTIQFEQADLKEPLERKDLQMLCSFPASPGAVPSSCAAPLGRCHWPMSMAVRSTTAVPRWTCPRVMALVDCRPPKWLSKYLWKIMDKLLANLRRTHIMSTAHIFNLVPNQ